MSEKNTSSDFSEQPESLRELTEEEVVGAARAFWLDELCEQRDEEDELPLLWEH